MKIVLPLLTVLTLATAHAQTQTSLLGGPSTDKNVPGSTNLVKLTHTPNRSVNSLKSWQDVHKQLKQSPFHLTHSSNHNFADTYDSRSNGEQFHNDEFVSDTFLSYGLNKNNDFRLAGRVVSNAAERARTEHTFRHVELRYRRKNILTEADNFVGLSIENRQAYNTDEKWRASRGTWGYSRTQLNFTKQFTDKFDLTVNVINFFNYRKNSNSQSANSSTRAKYMNRYAITPNYMFTDALSASFPIFYDNGYIDQDVATRKGAEKSSDIIYIDPGVNYVFTEWFNVDLDFGWALYASKDGRDGWGWDDRYSKTKNRGDMNNGSGFYWLGATLNFTVF